ncbi:MAG TPA: 3-deoxy-manno-octulosonate cytidylyltransferase, partial [Dehalococcoidia bacterium]|nr:3-deoxy-manno-octulosonate cytidylyltransferase [Dehalococcoidia bacterium]
IMVQGDEPMDTPKMIGEALQPILQDETVSVVNLMGDISDLEEFEDPNTVKVVVGLDGNAIYFSREPIPSRKKGFGDVPMRKQICVIPFRREFLLEFNQTPETPLEVIESVDMLRIIESGGRVKMVMTSGESYGVDTVADLEKVTERMNDDPLMARYC